MRKLVITDPDSLWFSSDHHFAHENIIKHCSRPYKTASEMDSDMIEKWNNVVPANAQVVYLGDMTMNLHPEDVLWYMRKLNGEFIRFIHGNHDIRFERTGPFPTLDMLIVEVHDGDERIVIHCSHYPMLSWYKMFRGSWHLYGHVHNNEGTHPNKMAYNVGVDVNNFEPVSFRQLQRHYEASKIG